MPPEFGFPADDVAAWVPAGPLAMLRLGSGRQVPRIFRVMARLKDGVSLEQARDDAQRAFSAIGKNREDKDTAQVKTLDEVLFGKVRPVLNALVGGSHPGPARGLRKRRHAAGQPRRGPESRPGRPPGARRQLVAAGARRPGGEPADSRCRLRAGGRARARVRAPVRPHRDGGRPEAGRDRGGPARPGGHRARRRRHDARLRPRACLVRHSLGLRPRVPRLARRRVARRPAHAQGPHRRPGRDVDRPAQRRRADCAHVVRPDVGPRGRGSGSGPRREAGAGRQHRALRPGVAPAGGQGSAAQRCARCPASSTRRSAPTFRRVSSSISFSVVVTTNGQAVDHRVYLASATSDFFEAVGTRVVEGHGIDEADEQHDGPVIVLSESAARLLSPEKSLVGRELPWPLPAGAGGGRKPLVVGTVPDVKYGGLDAPAFAAIYARWVDLPASAGHLVVRTSGDPSFLAPTLRKTLRNVDPSLAAGEIRTLRQEYATSLADRRIRLIPAAGFAGLAVALALVGLWRPAGPGRYRAEARAGDQDRPRGLARGRRRTHRSGRDPAGCLGRGPGARRGGGSGPVAAVAPLRREPSRSPDLRRRRGVRDRGGAAHVVPLGPSRGWHRAARAAAVGVGGPARLAEAASRCRSRPARQPRRPTVKNRPPSRPSVHTQPSCASHPSTRQLSTAGEKRSSGSSPSTVLG